MRCADAAGATVAVSRMYYKLIVTGHTFVQPASIDIPTREYTTLWGLFLVLYLSVILKSLLFTLLGVNRSYDYEEYMAFLCSRENLNTILCSLKSTAYI